MTLAVADGVGGTRGGGSARSSVAGDYQTLLQFLYRAPIGLIQADLAGEIEIINPIAARLLMPLSHDGALANLFVALADVAPQLRQLAASTADASGMVCEALRLKLPAGRRGHERPGYLSISLFRFDASGLMAVLVDGTIEALREEETLSRGLGAAARLDSLTGMPNRLAVIERLRMVMQRPTNDADRAFALFYITCDRLRQVDDAFGRPAGDELLSLLADRLNAMLAEHHPWTVNASAGAMAAHIDEGRFIVMLEGARRRSDVDAVAQRLVDLLAEPYLIGPGEIHCGASIGVVLNESAAVDADTVLQYASLAMAEAERSGGGRFVVFEKAMQQRAKQRTDLEADLRRAIAENQLFVVYQPVVGLQAPGYAGGGVDRSVGVEALVRWRHPTRGILPPDLFIGMAEECGVIRPLGEFVLRTACDQFMAWQAQLGAAAPRLLAVNLSRGQIGEPGLVAKIDAIIRSSGIPPARLQLEVTESLAAQSHAVQSRLHELKALGLTLALDDFGTGYSSLSSLVRFPVDTLKIDRSFVTDAPTSPRRRALVDAAIRVAHALDMTTVAEGIENEAQAKVVRDFGCDKGQGYLYSEPLVSGDLVRWLRGA